MESDIKMLPEHNLPSPHSGPLAQAEALCLEEEARLLAELAGVRQILANLRAMRSIPRSVENDQIPEVVPDEYGGMKLSYAFEAYMKRRRGYKIPLARIIEDLIKAGAEVKTEGSKNTPTQNVKITIRNRPRLVNVDDETWTVWLADTADLPPKKRRRQVRKKSPKDPKELS